MNLRQLEKRIRGFKKSLLDNRIVDLQNWIGRSPGSLAHRIRQQSFATYGGLGQAGEFGNQLFQIAVVLGFCAKYPGVRPIFPRWYCENGKIDYAPYFPYFEHRESIRHWTQYEQPHFAYREIPFRLNVSLKGNFQSEKYFPTLRPELQQLFRAPAAANEEVEAFRVARKLDQYDVLHMRFYVRPQDIMSCFHTSLDTDYYLRSLDAMGATGHPLVLVSNDSARAEEFARLHIRRRPLIIASNPAPLVDFYLISRARNIIMSNSTYSWWAAYLSESAERVFAPTYRRWFTEKFQERPSIGCADIIPERFTQIDF